MRAVLRWWMLVVLSLAAVVPVLGAPTAGAAPGQSVLVLGDSLSVGDDQFGGLVSKLTGAGFAGVEVDALVGRSTRLGIKKLTERASVPEVLIIALGTNDVALGRSAESFRSYVEKAVAFAGPNRMVVWVDIAIARNEADVSLAAQYNRVLAEEAQQNSNLVVARWSGRQKPEQVAHDKVHLSPEGYRRRATFLAEVSWFFSTLQQVQRAGR